MSGPFEAEAPVQYFEVTNGLEEEIVMGFHGDKYEWQPGEKLICSEAAIRHIFGYGEDDKSTAFLRLGWINSRPECNMKAAMAKIAKIKCVPVTHAFNEVADARAKRGGKKASASDRPFADAGESSGGDADADQASSPLPPQDGTEAA